MKTFVIELTEIFQHDLHDKLSIIQNQHWLSGHVETWNQSKGG